MNFLQVSVGYFISDLGMICWLYPTLGGVEYVSETRIVLLNSACFFLKLKDFYYIINIYSLLSLRILCLYDFYIWILLKLSEDNTRVPCR